MKTLDRFRWALASRIAPPMRPTNVYLLDGDRRVGTAANVLVRWGSRWKPVFDLEITVHEHGQITAAMTEDGTWMPVVRRN